MKKDDPEVKKAKNARKQKKWREENPKAWQDIVDRSVIKRAAEANKRAAERFAEDLTEICEELKDGQ
jgi:hypothetical protein